jgi:hypothetical protein
VETTHHAQRRQDARGDAEQSARLAHRQPGKRRGGYKSGGSHVVFEHPDLAEALSVPARRPIKPIWSSVSSASSTR